MDDINAGGGLGHSVSQDDGRTLVQVLQVVLVQTGKAG